MVRLGQPDAGGRRPHLEHHLDLDASGARRHARPLRVGAWVRVYDSMVEGAKQGFQVAIRIIPYLVVILVVVGMFRPRAASTFS